MNNLNEWFAKAFLVLLSLLSPIQPLMIAAGALLFLDFITGIWAAIKTGKPITSEKMRRTVAKAVGYQLGLIGALIMERWLMPDVPVTKLVGSLIALTEGKSFFENLHIITGVDFVQLVIDKIHSARKDNEPK